jgi:hypothetical protein
MFLRKILANKHIYRNIHYVFKPNFKTIAHVNPTYSISDLDKEVSVYSASEKFCRKHCGQIANDILDNIPDSYYSEASNLGLYVNCDIRIHRLYPGVYPAYPGWHCDGEYRKTYFAQPDLNEIKISKHIIVTVSSAKDGVSNPEFLNMEWHFDSNQVNQTEVLWKQVNQNINNSNIELDTIPTFDGEIILFDNWSLHRVLPAKIRGWRLFFRMSMWHKPNLDVCGKISKQETVYLNVNNAGW